MNRRQAILLTSSQGRELQKIIRTSIDEQSLAVDSLDDYAQLLSQLSRQTYDILIVDLALLTTPGALLYQELKPPRASLLKTIKDVSARTEVILLAQATERQQALEQLQQGAADYILFPVEASELLLRVNRLLEMQHLKSGSKNQPPWPDPTVDELGVLYEASREINQTLQLDESLRTVLTKACRFTGVNLVRVYLTNAKGNLSEQNFVTNSTKTSKASVSDKFKQDALIFKLVEQASFTQEIACYPDTSLLPGWEEPTIQSALLIPMLSRDKLIAVLVLTSELRSAFSDSHIRWLSIFCDQAAIAIENAYLFQNLSSAYIDLAQSREEILHSRNTLQVLFDGITDGLYILDHDLTISAINQIEAQRLGYRPDDLIGKGCLSLDWAKSAPELLNRIKESLQTGQETTWISSENETEPFLKNREFRIYPIRDRLAQIEQVVVFAQDVSERRRWQASLFRSANLAAVGQLAGSIAHQINNPLTVTMANSQLLLLEAEANSEVHELATAIFKAGERIQNIVENLLGFSNQETYFFVETDLIETIEGALALVLRSLKKAGIELVKDYQVRPTLSASVSHLKLVWMNLLLNARDAVADHTLQPRVTISTRAVSEHEVAVAITDNGIGIPEKDFEQLFRPFFTTKPVGRALGLGLYSANAIVERHRGQIKVSSQPGLATTFEVVLPLDNPRDL